MTEGPDEHAEEPTADQPTDDERIAEELESAPDGAARESLDPEAAAAAAAEEPVSVAARRPGIEAVLFLADEPIGVDALAELVEATPAEVEEELHALAEAYQRAGSGIEVRQAAGGWRLYTAPPAAPVVRRFALLGRTGRLTQAALETLAVIAYKQPIGRQAISDIRGVNADGAVRSLVARGFVAEVGRDPGPGQAVLYGTTRTLLERLGLNSLEELPALTEFLPEAPAPDEPALDRLRDVRRRLAAGEDLPSGLGGRSAAETNTGEQHVSADEGDEAMPPPTAPVGGRDEGGEMDELTDRLEAAARSAMGRLRAAVSASEPEAPTSQPEHEAAEPEHEAAEPDAGDDEEADRG